MPKHIIEFNLPDEQGELDTVLNAGTYVCVLDDIRQILRKYRKHYEFRDDETAYEFWEKLSTELYDALSQLPD